MTADVSDKEGRKNRQAGGSTLSLKREESGLKEGDGFFLGLYDVEQEGHAQQIEDVKKIGGKCGNFDVTPLLPYVVDIAEKDAQSRAGNRPQVRAVDDDLMLSVLPAPLEGRVEFRDGMGVEGTPER